MSEEENSVQRIPVLLRKDVCHVWGEKLDSILSACRSHMLDAVATELVLHQRFHCLGCKHQMLIEDFFTWLNEEGYSHVLKDFDYHEFMAHVVRWSQNWAREQMLHPCTDGMPSSEVH